MTIQIIWFAWFFVEKDLYSVQPLRMTLRESVIHIFLLV